VIWGYLEIRGSPSFVVDHPQKPKFHGCRAAELLMRFEALTPKWFFLNSIQASARLFEMAAWKWYFQCSMVPPVKTEHSSDSLKFWGFRTSEALYMLG
jgi:hypothetical protein